MSGMCKKNVQNKQNILMIRHFLSHVEMLKRNYQRAAKNEIFVSDGRENEIQ